MKYRTCPNCHKKGLYSPKRKKYKLAFFGGSKGQAKMKCRYCKYENTITSLGQ